ncbi:DUF4241 domain-containing protein [Actinoplanes solisilvae]|uniref:DUF4241 domain-containing protein n=1 Tax=Actinoplanes solisilvae TaxID=2486853 RepID=UPI000FDBB2B8|nr:DUF4241 domain-containing protein [Actinoplanes solisilvae]
MTSAVRPSSALGRREALALTALAFTTAACERPVAFADPGEEPGLFPEQTATLFTPGSTHVLENGDTATAELFKAGRLKLPTGRLVAVDPHWLPRRSWQPASGPFSVRLPPGAYAVELALLRWTDLRCAAARLTVRDEPTARWDLAVRPGEDPATLEPNHFFGTGVDSATIALYDGSALDDVDRLIERDPEALTVRKADSPISRDDPAAIVFRTGWGAGNYPTWIGRSPKGEITSVVVDLLMLASPTTGTPWRHPVPRSPATSRSPQ